MCMWGAGCSNPSFRVSGQENRRHSDSLRPNLLLFHQDVEFVDGTNYYTQRFSGM